MRKLIVCGILLWVFLSSCQLESNGPKDDKVNSPNANSAFNHDKITSERLSFLNNYGSDVVVEKLSDNGFIVSANSGDDKEVSEKLLSDYEDASSQIVANNKTANDRNSLLSNYTYLSGNSGRIYFNSSYLYNKFSESSYYHSIADTTYDVSGSSYSSWLGATPFNADRIEMTDTWAFSGVAYSLNVSNVLGGGMTQTSSSVSYKVYVDNNYYLSHSYSGALASGDLTWINRYCSTSFKFGANWVTASCAANSILW
jgi:hypothetical protein